MLRKAFYLFLSLLILPWALSAAEAGKPAPAFEAKDVNGHEQSLARYKGKIIVVEWNNPGCPFVKKHYGSGNMQALQKYATAKGVIWLTVNSGASGKQGHMDAEAAKEELKEVGAHQTAYILDSDGAIGNLYGAKTTPHMFVINRNGVLAYSGAIDDMPTPDAGDIKKSHNYVKAAIDALLAGKPVAVPQTKPYGCSVKYKD